MNLLTRRRRPPVPNQVLAELDAAGLTEHPRTQANLLCRATLQHDPRNGTCRDCGQPTSDPNIDQWFNPHTKPWTSTDVDVVDQ